MKKNLCILLVSLFAVGLIAKPIVHNFKPFPPDKVIYHADNVTLVSVSAIAPEKDTGDDQFIFKFNGDWEIIPELSGADIKPQDGVSVGANTAAQKQQLARLHDQLSALKDKKISIEILGGAVNKDRRTYAWTDQVRIK